MRTYLSSRTVRIFLSSTFRDFGEERDLLVRRVFPELRRKCRERQVTLVDVDLRWGITEEEAQQGRVLPICLAEIDHARPFFIGLLGERYGWIPEPRQYAAELLERQPWLREHQGGRSVTELEVLHGVLNNPAMAGQALFYFRDPAYAAGRGGDYTAESVVHQQKLHALKERIRRTGFPVVENYPDPATAAGRIGADLWRIIEARYPQSEIPDALALERQRHEAYGASRLSLYLGGEEYLQALDHAYGAGQRMVLIRGASGGGKSALIVNWLESFKEQHPSTRVFVHHLGATSDAGEPDRLVRRWIQELARALGETAELPTDRERLFDELPVWLAKASALGRLVMVLDGLDKLRAGRDLRWLPTFVPEGMQLLASCLDGEVLEAAKRRHRWDRELAVEPLRLAEQRELVRRYLGIYRKSLTGRQEEEVLGHPLAGNPLFLRTVLEELRVHGVHEGLDGRIKTLLGPPASKGPGEAPTVDDVFEHVLERVEADNGVGEVRRTMCALWASRGGLAQDELLGATGVAPARWAWVQLGLEEMLLESGGRWTFAHDYARKALQERYLAGKREQREEHVRLAAYFGGLPVDARVAEELPWQWEKAGEAGKLKACLTDWEIFVELKERGEYELLGYWVRLGADINAEYEAAWQEWGLEADPVLTAELAKFLGTAGYYTTFALGLREAVLRLTREKLGADHPDTLVAMGNLAYSYFDSGRRQEALEIEEEVLRLRREKLGAEHPDTLSAMSNLAVSYSTAGRLEEALVMKQEVLRLRRNKLGREHPDTLLAMENLAGSYSDAGRLGEALELREEVLRLRREILGAEHPGMLRAMNNLAVSYSDTGRLEDALGLFEEVLRLSRKRLGKDHPDTLGPMENLARSYGTAGRLEEALGLKEEVLRLIREKLGPDHPETLSAMEALAGSYSGSGGLEEAWAMEEELLRLKEGKLGKDHPDTLRTMELLADSYMEAGRLERAAGIQEEVLRLKRKELGFDHPKTLWALGRLASSLTGLGRLEEALVMEEELLSLKEVKLGKDHADTLNMMVSLADSYMNAGRLERALGMKEEVLRLTCVKLGPSHLKALTAMSDLAGSYSEVGRLEEALVMQEEVLRLRQKKLGADHPDTLRAMGDLANIYSKAGRQEEALGMLKDVLRLNRDKRGPNHRISLGAMNDLAIFYKRFSRLEEALDVGQELMRLTREVFGTNHPDTWMTIKSLASTLNALGRLPEAVTLLRQASAECPVVSARVRYNLACYECLSGNLEEARRLIANEVAAEPESKEQALQDSELAAIHEFIATL